MTRGVFGNVQPDDDPMSYCPEHELKYNPYKHSACPKCKGEKLK